MKTIPIVRAHRILVTREYCEHYAPHHQAMLVFDDVTGDKHEEYIILPAKDTTCYLPGMGDALLKLLDKVEEETIAASSCQTPRERTVHANTARTYLHHVRGIVSHE